MDRGIIRTARGANLNMTELKLKSVKPIVKLGDQKDQVRPAKEPHRQINVKGFMPAGIATSIKLTEEEPVEDQRTMADFTGITIDSPRHLKDKPENPVELANETLREIMGDLNEQYSNRNVEQSTKARRTKQS